MAITTRILVCDDEDESLKLLDRMLGNEGMSVETFDSGQLLLDRLWRLSEAGSRTAGKSELGI